MAMTKHVISSGINAPCIQFGISLYSEYYVATSLGFFYASAIIFIDSNILNTYIGQ